MKRRAQFTSPDRFEIAGTVTGRLFTGAILQRDLDRPELYRLAADEFDRRQYPVSSHPIEWTGPLLAEIAVKLKEHLERKPAGELAMPRNGGFKNISLRTRRLAAAARLNGQEGEEVLGLLQVLANELVDHLSKGGK